MKTTRAQANVLPKPEVRAQSVVVSPARVLESQGTAVVTRVDTHFERGRFDTAPTTAPVGPVRSENPALAVLRAREVVAKPAALTTEVRGALLGRAVSQCFSTDEAAALDRVVAAGGADSEVLSLLRASLRHPMADLPDVDARLSRMAAAIGIARSAAAGKPLSLEARALLPLLEQSQTQARTGYNPLVTPRDGELEAAAYKVLKTLDATLAADMVQNHPHIPTQDQLPALQRQMSEIKKEEGAFLKDVNLLAVMHQMGRAVPWLRLATEEFGLDPACYRGLSVQYSGSSIAIDRMNMDGYATTHHEDYCGPAHVDAHGDVGFDAQKEREVLEAVLGMLALHAQNGKPIVVVDDGGYVARVIDKHFPQQAGLFSLVEWTTRGIRQFEALPTHKQMRLVSGAESRPKVLGEPAFVADSLVEHMLVSTRAKFGAVKGRDMLVVGYGNIGGAAAHAMRKHNANVTVFDLRPDRRERAAANGFAVKDTIQEAVQNQDVVLAATGANSLPPDVVEKMRRNALVLSGSSVDIETRGQTSTGNWKQDFHQSTLNVGGGGFKMEIRLDFLGTAAGGVTPDAILKGSFSALPSFQNASLDAASRLIEDSGFVINLDRRCRVMALAREELILMNVTEALSQAARNTSPGKQAMDPTREERVMRIYAEEHPAEWNHALQFQEEFGESAIDPAAQTQKLMKAVQQQRFYEDKIDAAMQHMHGLTFTTETAAALLSQFPFEQHRMTLLKAMAPLLSPDTNRTALVALFHFGCAEARRVLAG